MSAQAAYQPVPGGCDLCVAAPVVVGAGATNANGELSVPLAVPTSTALVGVPVCFQAGAGVPGGPLLGAVESTNGLEVITGS